MGCNEDGIFEPTDKEGCFYSDSFYPKGETIGYDSTTKNEVQTCQGKGIWSTPEKDHCLFLEKHKLFPGTPRIYNKLQKLSCSITYSVKETKSPGCLIENTLYAENKIHTINGTKRKCLTGNKWTECLH